WGGGGGGGIHSEGGFAEGGAPGPPPQQPLAGVIVNLREDPMGRMHARHQVDDAQYRAARAYQRLYDSATIGNLSPADPARVRVDGRQRPDPISAARMAAAKRLRSVERTLTDWHGHAGLSLTRCVLTGVLTVDKTARDFGARTEHDRRFWGLLFRKCLDVLAKALGFATTAARPRRRRLNGGGIPDIADASMHAGDAELGDPGLRRGRPNG